MRIFSKVFSLLLVITLFFSCGSKNESESLMDKPADSMSIEKIDSLLSEKVTSPDTSFLISDSTSPEAKILPLASYLNASGEILEWAQSAKIDRGLRLEVKAPDQITKFLEKHITSLIKKHGFISRIHYLVNENKHVEYSREARKISDDIQQALNLKITPYVSDSLLSDSQKKDKKELIAKLGTALSMLKSDKYISKIKESMKMNYSQDAFDRINEELFTESGFISYSDAMKKISDFRHDPEVQDYLIELNRIATELVEKLRK